MRSSVGVGAVPIPDGSRYHRHMLDSGSRHCVAVIGGAVAGAEIAGALAEKNTEVVVFEQNPRPYGKIEDGLPRWHLALREKEYRAIRARLSQGGVHFVPNTRIAT